MVTGLKPRDSWVLFLALLDSNWTPLGKSLPSSLPQFLHQKDGMPTSWELL